MFNGDPPVKHENIQIAFPFYYGWFVVTLSFLVNLTAAVGIMGGASFIGTTISGYSVDCIDPRKILSIVYGLRGATD